MPSTLRTPATVEITVEETSEDSRDLTLVRLASGEVWQMVFIPMGWKPQPGTFQAEACFVPTVEWPTLTD